MLLESTTKDLMGVKLSMTGVVVEMLERRALHNELLWLVQEITALLQVWVHSNRQDLLKQTASAYVLQAAQPDWAW